MYAVILYGLVSIWATTSSATCYTPDGSDRNLMFDPKEQPRYTPCNNDTTKVSMCCSVGFGDVCLSGGTCFNPGSHLYWRESCTDRTWKDPACIKLFVNGTGLPGSADSVTGVNNITDVVITRCGDGSWCHGSDAGSQACCNSGEGVFIAADGTQTNQDPNITTSNNGDTTSTQHNPTQNSSWRGLSLAVKIVIGVGSVVVGLFIIGTVLWFVRRRSRLRTRNTRSGQQVYLHEKDGRCIVTDSKASSVIEPSTALLNSRIEIDDTSSTPHRQERYELSG